MKKVFMMLVVAMIVSVMLTLVCTEAKADRADCECWFAEYDSVTHWCIYYFCLVPQNPYDPQTGDYYFHFKEKQAGVWQSVALHPERLSSCGSPCIAWWGDFYWAPNDLNSITWYVEDHVNQGEIVWTDSKMPWCGEIPF
jgi:hypothetical protein